jgi:DNA-binding CsgD family transcriptional regulator
LKKLNPISITSTIIILIGIGLLALNIVLGDQYNVALPLVFWVLGGGFFILIFRFRQEWNWASYLYIPAFLLMAFGVIFTLNVLTKDWSSWAYAWILLIAAIGIGGIFAERGRSWPVYLRYTAWGLAIAGITFFGVFGVIKGGEFIQIVAPILLVAAGFGLRFLHQPETAFRKSGTNENAAIEDFRRNGSDKSHEDQLLSDRELEVLSLISKGLTNQQIALRLSVAESTVKTHINNIYGKLGVQSRVQAINKARYGNILKD